MLSYIFAGFAFFRIACANQVAFQKCPGQDIGFLSKGEVEEFKAYSFYAAAAYCDPSDILKWSCGVNCVGNSDFQPSASGGDGNAVQFWYVGWDPTLSSVIVAHQGTNPIMFLADQTDLNLFPTTLNSTLFPGLSSSIQVHSGFAEEHAKTAATILQEVSKVLAQHNASSVTITGHSLGAALALLDAVYLPLHLPAITSVRMIGYGMPRVGNAAFADYVDTSLALMVTRVNNRKDPVPIVPWRTLGYVHPSGEVHIQKADTWVVCQGQDNTSPLCIVGDVPNVLDGNILDHLGLYDDNIIMGICFL